MNLSRLLFLTAALLIVGAVAPPLATARDDGAGEASLTEQGRALEAHYTARLGALKDDIVGAMPALKPEAVDAYKQSIESVQAARGAVEEAEKAVGELTRAQALVNHAKGKWIGGADQGIAAAREKLAHAQTDAAREAAREELAKWQKNREDGVQALHERQAALDRVLQRQPELEKNLKDAREALAEAKAASAQALAGLGVQALLASDALDARLAAFVVLTEATPRRLALFAQQGDAQQGMLEDLLGDGDLLVQMAVADGAADGRYGRALTIYRDIQQTSDRATQGTLRRLALAVALEHATPIDQRSAEADADAPDKVDPVGRYLHYEKAFLAGELDPAFGDMSVWDLRMVVNGYEPDATLAWGRDMLRNYRPDHITTDDYRWRYVGLVRSDIRYGSQENKFDEDRLQFFQNILKNGGICGRRAFFGRFILRAFGVPTTARPQRGHAALAHWTPDGWVVCLGAGWGSGWTKTPYKDDLDFLATTQARATGARYLQVKRAHWIGDVMGEPRTWGALAKEPPAFWNSVALAMQRAIIDASEAETLAAVGEDIGEANETSEAIDIVQVDMRDEDRQIHVDQSGVITIPAAAAGAPTRSTGKILFMDSTLGGTQLHYSRNGGDEDFTYTFDVPVAGTYALTLQVVTPSWRQKLKISANGHDAVELELPFTVGAWATTEPVQLELPRGANTLTFSRKGVEQSVAHKGLTLRQITLTPAG